MIQTKLFKEFFNSEKAGGLVLLIATVISLIISNTTLQHQYIDFWEHQINGHSITEWINDGLMAIFFLLIGLELEREIYIGELSNIRNASLPIIAAIGGMAMPAIIYMVFNYQTPTQHGVAIPTATDIAFAIGILSLLGNRVPASLKVFLTALAVIDDLGAIIIIAVFYTTSISFINLAIALGIFVVLIILNKLKVRNLIPYLIGGLLMWYFMLHSGIHATIAGVLLAFTIPFGDGGEKSPSYILQHFLHNPVSFLILPLFAIANTCIAIPSDWLDGFMHVNSLGIITGLSIGKPLGIFLFSFIGVMAGICTLPGDIKWKHIIGVGCLGGIGFTMSIFITLLAFDDEANINISKIAILTASLLSGIIGFLFLKFTLREQHVEEC
ncbi:MAG: Na+/H+ antiporter NhaA [Bacteroidetes bacterium]|nr:Na+/H+ antiporter NhaA [Bacteroidota bacterium]